LWFGLIN